MSRWHLRSTGSYNHHQSTNCSNAGSKISVAETTSMLVMRHLNGSKIKQRYSKTSAASALLSEGKLLSSRSQTTRQPLHNTRKQVTNLVLIPRGQPRCFLRTTNRSLSFHTDGTSHLVLLVLQWPPRYFAQNLSIEHSILFLNLNPPLLTIGVNVIFILLIQCWDCVQNHKNCLT